MTTRTRTSSTIQRNMSHQHPVGSPMRRCTIETLERRMLLSAYALTTLAQFGTNTTGAYPNALVMDGSGNLYGTTENGGPDGAGTVFQVDRATGAIVTLAAIGGALGAGASGLAIDRDGNLFGTAVANDVNGSFIGKVFELSKSAGSTWTFNTIAAFDPNDGLGPNLVLDATGNVYGTEGGKIFELSEGGGSSWTLSTLASIDPTAVGYYFQLTVVDASGNLYGTSTTRAAGDQIYELPKGAGSLTTLATFDPRQQLASLSIDTSGNLYGTTFTYVNDVYTGGTAFELSKDTESAWTLSTIATFPGHPDGIVPYGDLVVDASGDLYGTAIQYDAGGSALFELAKGNGSSRTLNILATSDGADWGSYINGGLVLDLDGNLYGSARMGGANGNGLVFELSNGTGSNWVFRTVSSFSSMNGAVPNAGLVMDSGGDLYGTTNFRNGGQGFGVGGPPGVFELHRGSDSSPTLGTLASFNDGVPYGSLVLDASGNLYGTTADRFWNGDRNVTVGASVFEVAAGSDSVTSLATFSVSPVGADLAMDAAGNLYGTMGGTSIFELSKGSGSNWTLNTLASFDVLDPKLVVDHTGNLYGTTPPYYSDDNIFHPATVFELSKANGGGWSPTTLATFDNSTPSDLVLDGSGNLYGMIDSDDPSVSRVVFELARASSASWTLSTLASFDAVHIPRGDLTLDDWGNLYGTSTNVDASGNPISDTVFELSGPSWALNALASFDPNDDLNPGVVVNANGNVYGTTATGGTVAAGTVFELVAQPSRITGTVWADANHNGVRDPGEGGLAGVTVFLDVMGDGKLDPGDPIATTDASGTYTFTGLAPGRYTVRQVLPDGYAATAPRGYAGTVTLSAGENAAGPDFGDVPISSVTLDFSYLVVLARNFGQAGTFADGDLNGDGTVGFDDLVILARSYGKGSAASRSTLATVSRFSGPAAATRADVVRSAARGRGHCRLG